MIATLSLNFCLLFLPESFILTGQKRHVHGIQEPPVCLRQAIVSAPCEVSVHTVRPPFFPFSSPALNQSLLKTILLIGCSLAWRALTPVNSIFKWFSRSAHRPSHESCEGYEPFTKLEPLVGKSEHWVQTAGLWTDGDAGVGAVNKRRRRQN